MLAFDRALGKDTDKSTDKCKLVGLKPRISSQKPRPERVQGYLRFCAFFDPAGTSGVGLTSEMSSSVPMGMRQ